MKQGYENKIASKKTHLNVLVNALVEGESLKKI